MDETYSKLHKIATSAPRINPQYQIYHFFAQDPEGRILEFQHFFQKIDWEFDQVDTRL
ncbi:MAG: hypothetical protein SCK70_04830 [bacterium]|nr:hypothetical protein [bacterium]